MHETTADDEASRQLEKFVVDPYFAPLMADSLAGALYMMHMTICSLCIFGCVYACDVATDSELYSRATSKYERSVIIKATQLHHRFPRQFKFQTGCA